MEKIEVEVIKAENYYKIVRKSDQGHIKSIKTQYVVDLIKEHGVIFRSHYFVYFSKEELCALAEHHYLIYGSGLLAKAGRMLEAMVFVHSKAKNRNIIHRENETVHTVLFWSEIESKTEIVVQDYHFRMFSTLPMLNNNLISAKQETLQL